jgi:4,5-dihydroxyphthalate decarboxylase
MADVTITLGCWNYDRLKPIIERRIGVEGCTVAPVVLKTEQLFPRAFQRQEFDVSELSFSSYLLQVTRGECAYVAIPVFPSRAFRHACIYVRTDRGIETPKDLEGKTVGVPEYQMTLALWLRGILQDSHGVDFRKIRYRTGGTNAPGRKERLPLKLPGHMDVKPIAEGHCLNDLLVSGELDAVMSPAPPLAFSQGSPLMRRLFSDVAQVERAYYRETGFFPIMHVVGVKKALVEQHPWLPANLFQAFVAAKAMTMGELDAIAKGNANRITLPWFAAEWEATKALMGEDFWPYGLPANRRELETLCRYSREQYLSERDLAVDELFDPSTMALPGR